jgi:truncated hemoglobin YjbI
MLTKKVGLALVLASFGVLAACGDDTTDTSGSGASGSTASSSSATSGSGSSVGSGGAGGAGGAGGGGGAGGSSATCSQEMFAKYKAAGFSAVNDAIIKHAVELTNMNPSPIGDSFKPTIADPKKTEMFRMSLASFLIQAYGGPKEYKGPSMEEVHKGMKITSEQYDYFIAHAVVPALTEVGVETKDITECFAPVVTDPAFKNSIINK